jgi:hypothetical protein
MEQEKVSNPVDNIPPQEEVTLRSSKVRRLSAIDAMSYVAPAKPSLILENDDEGDDLENDDKGDDDLAPTEAEKTMTVRSGCVILSKSMLGGGASARSSAACACALQASP